MTFSAEIELLLAEVVASTPPSHIAHQAAAAHGFLALYVGWLSALGIRPDGTLVRWNHETGDDVRPLTTPSLRRLALYQGARRYRALVPLIPARPAEATVCPACLGPGEFRGRPEVVCRCGGAGWVVEGEDPGEPTG